MTTARLQKQLAEAGYGSRRQIEIWIKAGRLYVDGELAVLGTKVTPESQISLDGKPLICRAVGQQPCRVLMYHKPEGQICTRHDPEERETIFDHLPKIKQARWINIGRLDVNTSGLLLLTTDGELANRLMHPKHAIEREYAVRILGQLTQVQMQQLLRGVKLDDGDAAFQSITHQGGQGANQWYQVTIAEGRKREVRRLFEAFDVKVSRLIRTRYGSVSLPKSLSRGKWRDLPAHAIEALAQSVGLKVRPYVAKRKPADKDELKKSLRSPTTHKDEFKKSLRSPSNDESKRFSRTADRDEPKRFSRTADRDEPKRFSRASDRDEPKRFSRTSDRDEPKRFSRTSDRDEPKRFSRTSDRDAPKRSSRTFDKSEPKHKTAPFKKR